MWTWGEVLVLVLCTCCPVKCQTVQTAINLTSSSTGLQTVNSSATVSITLKNENFLVYWRINTVNVIGYSYTGGDPNVVIYNIISPYQSRIAKSVQVLATVVIFELELQRLVENDNNTLIQLYDGSSLNSMGSVSFDVGYCSTTNINGLDDNLYDGCAFDCEKDFICRIGWNGSATGICQSDGSFLMTENSCYKVTCNTSYAELPGSCTNDQSSIVDYNTVTRFDCLTGYVWERCVRTNSFDRVSYVLVDSEKSEILIHNIKVGDSALAKIYTDGHNYTVQWKINKMIVSECDSNTHTCDVKPGDYNARIKSKLTVVSNQNLLELELLSITKGDNNTEMSLYVNKNTLVRSLTITVSSASSVTLSNAILFWFCIGRWMALYEV